MSEDLHNSDNLTQTPRTNILRQRAQRGRLDLGDALDGCEEIERDLNRELTAAQATIETLLRERDEKQKLIEFQCRDWADDDTRIKAICEKHDVAREYKHGDYFKCMTTCVEELAEKLDALKVDKARLDLLQRIDIQKAIFGNWIGGGGTLRSEIDKVMGAILQTGNQTI